MADSNRERSAGLASLAAIATALAVAGCGSSTSHHARAPQASQRKDTPRPLLLGARAALATALHISPSAISARPFTPPSGVAACRFTAPHLNVVATLDSAPQAYQRFNRTTVEYEQNVLWAHLGAKAYPINIPHLGLDADWIPPQREIITTDGVRLITVTATTVPSTRTTSPRRSRRASRAPTSGRCTTPTPPNPSRAPHLPA